ncbi:MAG: DNA methyltransferase, partial [Methanothrix sp.]
MAESLETINKQNLFNNSGLFSNHYLENLIQKAPEWDDDAALPEVYSGIKEIYIKKGKNFENYVEADLEHNWIRPVLDLLGHYYGVQESVHHDPLKPDYAFFPDKSTLDEAYSYKQKKDSNYFYKKSVVVGDAKAWNIALDKSRQGKALREMANPSFQIDIYLRATPPKWAILTNGRLWRLYHEDTSEKMDCFYEVNLPELIELVERTGDLEPFKYFYLFFRRQAFPEVPLGPSFLDKVREESLSYAQKIGSDLQENVYKAMKVLADGFFAEPSNSLSHSEKDIRDVQDNSMRLLYRLLFIFYAESRKLLNTDNRRYREMSLRKLKEEISEKLDQGDSPLAVRSTYWEGLRDLFRLINDGSEAFGYSREEFYIPAYNGGLFDPEKNPFLSSKKIGNSYLAAAIDLLARSEGERGAAFVDYSSLDIRHLGSIYEGILEYRLHLAEESMAAVKEKGKEVWLAQSQVGSRKVTDRVDAGRLYLVTDKGERKATGSFYTPEYIVKHLVKNTLGPLIDKMIEEAMMSSELRGGLFKKLLSIKVLDPAMGSGHFLVEATDYIAREIIHAREIARQEDLDSEEVAEADIHWARREVVRNCIYGVDLNPMAVELAKLSLWLTTVASNKPLSFLDHHLRCGNSLIGADLDRLAVLPGGAAEQTPLWSFGLRSHTEGLLKKYSLMAALPDDNLQMVKWKEDQFRQIKEGELSRRLAELANVWLSTYFGNKVSDDDYYEMQNHLSPEKFPDWSGLRSQKWFLRAAELAAAKRFFHWELEFPEAFQGENRGFDVVIGNPPYDEMSEEAWGRKIDEMIYFQDTEYFIPALGHRVNIYRLFISQALTLTRLNGWHGFIVPLSL